MRIVFMLVGTILSILYIVLLKKGEVYISYVENLDEEKFPMSELYVTGFVLMENPILSLKGNLGKNLKTQASLLYELQYAEYYASVAWAQALSLTHLFLAVTFLAAGLLYDSATLMLGAGIFMSVVIAVYCLEDMKNRLDSRTKECEMQLPEVVSSMAILVNSGMVLKEAWKTIAYSRDGAFYELMKKATENMNNGYSDADAIFMFGREINSPEIKKFTSALLQSMEKGGTELAGFLSSQSSEIWNSKRQRMLQEGEKAATKLLIPIVLIFGGIMVIVLTAAFAGALF